MRNQEYLLGLNLCAGAVGWCVTDANYHILKQNRKSTIGSALFPAAETAGERRAIRCARRRLQRQHERIRNLQGLFAEEINKVDPGFFLRLKESRYVWKDKEGLDSDRPEFPYTLFVDRDYSDREYHQKYPTIYHLRKELMENSSAHDIRLVYLAIAHILKHRGHFLSNIDVNGKGESFEELIGQLLTIWNSFFDCGLLLQDKELESMKHILLDTGKTKTEKKKQIIALLDRNEKQVKELVSLLVGASVSLDKLFADPGYKNLEENKLQFDSASYEEKEGYYQEALGDSFALVAAAKAVYNWCALSRILKNNPQGRLSDAKVADYEKHKKDLRILKRALQKYCPDSVNRILRISQKGLANYTAYIGMTKYDGKKKIVEKRCSKEDFYKLLEKEVLSRMEDCKEKTYICQQIALGQFLPKQKVSDNSVIPYQIHEKELKQILENAEGYLPFLKKKDDSGFTVSEKILQLLTFRIPFYIGPLNNQKNNHAWVVRREKGKVYPWNFDQKVDAERSAEEFILRMTNKCTYLKKEDVLPAGSLLFEKYKVLNELNTVKIRGERLPVPVKQKVFEDLFCCYQKVTRKKLLQYLKSTGVYDGIGIEDISGIDQDFQSSMKSLLAFKQIPFDATVSVKEDIIRDITLFGADQSLLKKRLMKKYPAYQDQIPAVIKYVKCDGWAPFSRKLLEGLNAKTDDREPVGTIMYYLWNTQQNFNEILFHTGYGFQGMIEKENADTSVATGRILYSLVEDLYVSPAVRRQIWVALKIIDEVQGFMGCPPKRIFVEMAREKQESKRTSDRKSQIKQMYAHAKPDKQLLDELESCTNEQLRKDRLFLYFIQKGRSAYTGEKIPFAKALNGDGYNIDHIYPRSLTADDSLDNLVLIETRLNQAEKKDNYPIDEKYRNRMLATWKEWHSEKLLSDEKYRRLTRTTALTREELCGYVNRQLVEVRQSTKALAELLHQIMPEKTEIVYVKAGHVADFRRRFDLSSAPNDSRYALEAYLDIIVGNVFHLKFTKDVRRFFLEKGTYRTYNLYKMFDRDVVFLDEQAWDAEHSISTVREMFSKTKVMTTRYTFEKKGKLFDVQPLKKGCGQVPLKEKGRGSDIGDYGGYNGAAIAYFVLVRALNKKGKPTLWILPVPLYKKSRIESSATYAKEYFEKEYGLNQVEILRKFKMQTLFVYQGFRMRLAGKSGTQLLFHNANQIALPEEYNRTVNQINRYMLELQKYRQAALPGKIKEKDLDDLYLELCSKLHDSVYQVMFGRFYDIYRSGYKIFKGLPKETKAEALYQLMKLFQCSPEMPNFSLIGGVKTPAGIRIGMNITDRDSLAVIYQSVTGIYEKIERIV